MDKFDEMLKNMKSMPPAEMAAAMTKAREMCICGTCPTYTKCAKDAKELLFCAIGGSFTCIQKEKDCICPDCPLVSDLGLKYTFFCTRGAERAQRYGT